MKIREWIFGTKMTEKGKVTIYSKEYELLKKAAFGDLKERQEATKALRRFTTEALRHENGL